MFDFDELEAAEVPPSCASAAPPDNAPGNEVCPLSAAHELEALGDNAAAGEQLAAISASAVAAAAKILGEAALQDPSGAGRRPVPADWADVKRGRDLFVAGWGGFDVNAALQKAQSAGTRALNTARLPTVSELRSYGYVGKFFSGVAEPMHRERLREALLEPHNALARHVVRHPTFWSDPTTANRMDEVAQHLSVVGAGAALDAVLEENPRALLRRLARERAVHGHKFVRFSHLCGLLQPVHFSADGHGTEGADAAGEGGFQLLALEDSAQVVRAAQELNNCAADYVGDIRRKRCALVVLRRGGRLLAMGEWDLRRRRWAQVSEPSDEPVRPGWQQMFDALAAGPLFDAHGRLELPGEEDDGVTAWQPSAARALAIINFDAQVDAETAVRSWLQSAAPETDDEGQIEVAGALLLCAAKASLDLGVLQGLITQRADVDAMTDQGQTALMMCTASLRVEAVRLLLEAAGDVNARDIGSGRTALMMAAAVGSAEIVAALLERRANVNIVARSTGKTALVEAVEGGHWAVARALIGSGAALDIQRYDGRTALILAAEAGRAEEVQLMVARRASPNLRGDDGRSALAVALQGARWAAARALAAAPGLDLEARQSVDGQTALMLAAALGHCEGVELLLECRASTETASASGDTALAVAAGGSRWHAVHCLAERGASVDIVCAGGGVPLTLAAEHGEVATVDFLVARRANINASCAGGRTALATAAAAGHAGLVRSLLAGRAAVDAAGPGGSAPLVAAAAAEKWPAVLLLLEGGASLDARDSAGRTALVLAAARGHAKTVARLAEARAALEAQGEDGRTALVAAAAEHQWMVVRRLADARANLEAERGKQSDLAGGKEAAEPGDVRQVLLRAAEALQWDTVVHLARRRADVCARGTGGRTALLYAAENGQEDAVWTLLKAAADPDAPDNNGDTPLLLACNRQLEGVMRLLLEAGADAGDAITRLQNPFIRQFLQEWQADAARAR